jgi:hypothetical protein
MSENKLLNDLKKRKRNSPTSHSLGEQCDREFGEGESPLLARQSLGFLPEWE